MGFPAFAIYVNRGCDSHNSAEELCLGIHSPSGNWKVGVTIVPPTVPSLRSFYKTGPFNLPTAGYGTCPRVRISLRAVIRF